MELDLTRFTCPQPKCPDFGRKGRENLRPHGHYGSGEWLQIYCRSCKRTFSERRTFPLFPMRLQEEQVVRMLRDLSAKTSIRGVAQKEGVDKMTVQALVKLAEERRERLRVWLAHDRHVRKEVVKDIDHFLKNRDELKRKNRFA